jgi:hypothetical protein
MRIVDAACPWLTLVSSVDLSEFRYALSAPGLMYRRSEPDSSRAFHYFLDGANEMLSTRWGASSVSGCALLGAILAHADIPWPRANAAVGQMLEVGLDLYNGRMGVVTRTLARIRLSGKMAHDDLVCPPSVPACGYPARRLAVYAFHAQLSRRRRSACGARSGYLLRNGATMGIEVRAVVRPRTSASTPAANLSVASR